LKRIIVLSGKGGTGKTTIAVSLAFALADRGYSVGICDVDLTGPDVPKLLGISDEMTTEGDMLKPIKVGSVAVSSLALMVPEHSPILWRGEIEYSAVIHLITRTNWGKIDFLIIDAPPGSGSPVQGVLKEIKLDGAIVVTMPSILASGDAVRIVEALAENQVPILGEIRNFTHFKCECGRVHRIFSENFDLGIPLLGEIPIDPKVAETHIINDFDWMVDRVLLALRKPTILPKRKKSFKRIALEIFLKKFLR